MVTLNVMTRKGYRIAEACEAVDLSSNSWKLSSTIFPTS
jgi:hypothetical protein